ncbi:hypothetical protein GUJ93_ZPchr0002g26079 [Zizania palustris]|uniref:Uncharacterized protein n=1 Tax=Zizania palustris TaxID=103762 RepID=A0A8J5RS74_ZIZPA|nr:hypothetical protein GUJ93_ZPchr0002g26079 [Zizania palustris]
MTRLRPKMERGVHGGPRHTGGDDDGAVAAVGDEKGAVDSSGSKVVRRSGDERPNGGEAKGEEATAVPTMSTTRAAARGAYEGLPEPRQGKKPEKEAVGLEMRG